MSARSVPVRASSAARVVALAAVVLGGLARADEGAGDPRAFVEVRAPRPVVYVGEVVPVRVRVGVDAARVPAGLVPLVRQRLDLPLHVEVPLLRGRPGLAVLPEGAPSGTGPRLSLALNDDVASVVRVADATHDGVACAVFETERRWVVDAAGTLEAAAPTLRFAVATRFHDDLVQGRVPLDRRDVVVAGVPFAVEVRALPIEGRPAGFGGAIGRFTATAAASATDVDVGRTFRVTLRVAGPGNLERAEAPRLPALDGFHVYGALDEVGPDARSVVFEVAAVRADVAAFPAIPFAFFDPTPPAAYRVVATAPIALTVRGADRLPGREARPPAGGASSTPWALLALGAAGLGATLVLARRRAARRAAATDPAGAAVVAALAAFRGTRGDDVLDPFVLVLAAHLRVPAAAVVAPGLASRLVASGLDDASARSAAALVEALVGARYGGTAPAGAGAAAAAVVDAIEAAHRRARAAG